MEESVTLVIVTFQVSDLTILSRWFDQATSKIILQNFLNIVYLDW